MKEDTVQIARGYTEWLVKTGGFAKDMTMRDHYAGLAMQGVWIDEAIHEESDHAAEWLEKISKASYEMADAMLKERNK
jgi:hypothetical protein